MQLALFFAPILPLAMANDEDIQLTSVCRNFLGKYSRTTLDVTK
jgi:hypothetical protein